MPKKDNYTAGYAQTDQDSTPTINFKDVFGDVAGSAELTALEWLRKTPTALTIDAELTEPEWLLLIQSIEKIKKRYQWYLGDAMVYGIRRDYGATEAQIQRVVEITGKDDKTLHDYYKTALLFEVSERSDNLEFEQHRVIARAFSEDTPDHRAERLRWLHIAETEKMSGRKLTAEIALSKLPAPVDDNGAAPLPDSPTIEDEEEATDIILPVVTLDDPETRQSFSSLQKTIKTGSYHNATYEEAVKIHRQIAVARRALSLLEADLPRLKRGR